MIKQMEEPTIEEVLSRYTALEGDIVALDGQIKELTMKKKAKSRALDETRHAIRGYFENTGDIEHVVGRIKYTLTLSSGRTSIKVDDVNAVPDEFCKIERTPMKKEIEKHLQDHQVNWAAMEQGAPIFTIRQSLAKAKL